ncbi:unnamed protein product (macronuclear) [Paramecium tetraurelia]|uniref:ABC transporter domain-containing protein n=1 Tax=Paramecium tetraurelia TaxID=5888 RepID=A0DNP9_PARTE|nr:uncharacterized protein GSPATT00018862001 [Paramecium tetraurelia]CAK84666.1 unnamed protein product [Paramecium tetraurelia]|eukprot:XP_001452063.1 hypothetical protein (macronuclear) [Paramecium tetraurelia strain d4-2]
MNKTQVVPQQDQNIGLTLSFKNLSYKVNQSRNSESESRTILNNISGICPPGKVTAILGASGAGKTSLLNILAQRISTKDNVQITGDILANGNHYDSEKFARFFGYVMQNDILFATLTVKETLEFVANLKYTNANEKQLRVNYALKTLKLEKCQNTLIGNELLKGISGGERKRTSIGVELVRDPQCILLDEPTSGLDSFTAFVIINLLKKLSVVSKRTIVFTIHQPSSDIYLLFDQIFVLAKGRFVYQGSRDKMIDYFSSIGFECPKMANPLDYFISIIQSGDHKQQELQNIFKGYDNQIQSQIEEQLSRIQPTKILNEQYQASFKQQVAQILKRGILNVKRDKILVRSRVVMAVFLGLLVGGIFWGAANEPGYKGTQSTTGGLFFLVMSSFMTALNPVIVQFPQERDVFLREENSKLYSTFAYFVGKSSIEIPFLIIFPIIQQLICYWMIDLNDQTASIVIINILVCILLGLSGNSMGLMVGSMLSDARNASGIIPVVLMPLIAFSGFYANQSLFMDWISWLQYLSPMKYAFEALIYNEYDTRRDEFIGQTIQNQNPIDTFSLDFGLWNSIYVLIAFPIFFRILSLMFLYLGRSRQQ